MACRCVLPDDLLKIVQHEHIDHLPEAFRQTCPAIRLTAEARRRQRQHTQALPGITGAHGREQMAFARAACPVEEQRLKNGSGRMAGNAPHGFQRKGVLGVAEKIIQRLVRIGQGRQRSCGRRDASRLFRRRDEGRARSGLRRRDVPAGIPPRAGNGGRTVAHGRSRREALPERRLEDLAVRGKEALIQGMRKNDLHRSAIFQHVETVQPGTRHMRETALQRLVRAAQQV